jgi:hypothetical protein
MTNQQDTQKQKILEIAMKHCRDRETYPAVFPEDYGIGITFKDDEGKEYTTVLDANRDKQEVVLTIIRYACVGSVHFYGKLNVYEPELMISGENKRHNIGGYFNRFKPKECLGIEIELVRPVTKEEINDDPDRWHGYIEGDKTDAFNSLSGVKNVALLVFNARFNGEWHIREY